MLDGFRQATLNPAVASKWLRHVISSELIRVTESRAIIHADGGTDPDADWAMATAWQILARRGPNAELEEDDRATFIAEGRSPDALDQLEVTLSMLSQDVRSDSRVHRIRKAFRNLTGTEEHLPPSMVLLLRQLMIEGNAAAWANVPPVHDAEIAAGMAASMAAEMLQKRREDFPASHDACETGARAAFSIELSVSPPESKFKVEPALLQNSPFDVSSPYPAIVMPRVRSRRCRVR